MSDILEVLLVEDDKDMCDAIKNYADTQPDINIIKTTNNSDVALNCVANIQPDAIILDLELQQGLGDGLLFLKKLKELHRIAKPFILITTNNHSSIMYEQARQFGADFIFYKHNSSYTCNTPIDFLLMLKDTIFKFKKINQEKTNMFSESNVDNLKEKISLELSAVGIKHNVKGYTYIIDAILVQLINDDCYNYIDYLTNKYNKSTSNINRSMQRAINRAWTTQCYDDLFKHYTGHIDVTRGVPTVSEFISFYTNKFKNY
ncbi:MAG: response regulator [Lachnospiraceae bacterium]|nr:response regulator [Lachnospiraceae bacterium]